MEGLKWLLAVILSLAGGYFWHKVTGNWTSGAIAAAGAIVVLGMLINGHWTMALVSLGAAGYLLLSMVGDGSDPVGSRLAHKPAAPASAGQGEPMLAGASAAKADATAPKLGVAASAASEAGASQAGPAAGPVVTGDNRLRDCADCPELVLIPAGQFSMGSEIRKGQPADTVDARETPAHRVSVHSFAAGRFAVTKGEFGAFVRATQYKSEAESSGGCFGWSGEKWENHRSFHWREVGFTQADDHPVVCVSWNDAQAYLQWLSQVTHQSYRLLSEAEREYVTRAGSATPFWWGDSLSTDHANFDTSAPDFKGSHKGTARRATVPVSSFDANAFGLYNVHGNVWEWVQDCQHDTYAGAPVDGSAWTTKCQEDKRILRGGAWVGDPAGLRSASRSWFTPDFRFHGGGFRVARNLVKQK